MSVVVRMEMPSECEYCPMCRFYRENGRVWCNAANRILKQVWDHPDWTHLDVTKPDWCPIICQLPEGHGRLVDADAYSAEMKDRQDAAWKWRNEAIAEEDEVKLARAEGAFTAFVEAKLTWDKQVTIVPAEAERSET